MAIKGKPVNHDPREVFIAGFMQEHGHYNVFHAFYRELVKQLHEVGATPYVFCVNVDAVIAALMLGEQSTGFAKACEYMNELMMKVVSIVMAFAPYGVFALIARVFAKEGIELFIPVLAYVMTLTGALFLHLFVTLMLILKLMSGLSPMTFIAKIRPAQIFAFSTASSNATIPITYRCTTERMGADNSVASFTVPFGATINMDGTAIMQGVATVFLANVYGVTLGMGGYLTVIAMSVLASIGTAGVPGVGLVMLVLIGIVPAKFVLDLNSTTYQIERTRDAAIHLQQFYERNNDSLSEYLALGKNGTTEMPKKFRCDAKLTEPTIAALLQTLDGVTDYNQMDQEKRTQVRRYLLCLDDTAKKVGKLDGLAKREKADLDKLRKDLTATTEYAPLWVIFAVALALGIGTMVGWKRVVLTVGEKIGKQGMTYAQGMSAQITASIAIGLANVYSLPVSTTHVLSSGVAGTMVANKSGLQFATVRNILMAWVLTLPATILLSAGLFWLGVKLFV